MQELRLINPTWKLFKTGLSAFLNFNETGVPHLKFCILLDSETRFRRFHPILNILRFEHVTLLKERITTIFSNESHRFFALRFDVSHNSSTRNRSIYIGWAWSSTNELPGNTSDHQWQFWNWFRSDRK